MPSYSKQLQKHLSVYKTERLGVKEAGIFRHQGRDIPCAHVLPKALKWLNILEPYRKEVREHVQRGIKLHKYFHHLNSSQAFALNLFFPFFQAYPSESSVLIRALGQAGKAVEWYPEHILDKAEGTNVDVAWRDADSAWTYCEVKLTEQEFGRASGEARHHKKLASVYAPVLREHCPPELLESVAFFGSYQILRNVWLVAKEPTSRLVFLMPKQNEALWAPLHQVLDSLAPALRSRITVCSVETTLERLANSHGLRPELRWYATQLAEKYVLPRN
jgi:hypothetical protein